jgi:hypothetical protein
VYARRITVLLLLAVAAGACGDTAATRPPGIGRPTAGLYEVNATVLESEEHGPELCLGGIAASYPPQCGGVPLRNWDWNRVDGEERADGSGWGAGETTWGEYHLIGTYDDDSFTVVTSGPPEPLPQTPGDVIETPCDEPAGGWTAVDPRTSSERDLDRAVRSVETHPEFGGVWVDYYGGDELILNLAFTGSLERHERVVRQRWGGALCLTERDHSYAELDDVREEVSAHPDLVVLWSSTVENEGIVEIGVVAIDDETRAEIDERYGPGTVQIDAALRPVE